MNPYALRLINACALVFICGCAPWNRATRQVAEFSDERIQPGDRAYLQSHRTAGRNYGCSFIEFDGKGGFLSFDQYSAAERRLKRLKGQSSVLLVIYCHGWNNNSQSADVVRFMGFLRRLADSAYIQSKNLRVEGVYLGWRGSQYMPVMAKSDTSADPKLALDFDGESLTDSRWQLPQIIGTLVSPAKYLSYWSIKDRGEFHVSRVPLSRAVFGLAFDLKTPEDIRLRHNRVFVLGHSFGALVLEQAIGQASVGLLTSEWNRDQKDARWPIDLIVFLNSAAPSLYAKQLKEFLQDDYRTSARPRVVSLTSTGDWATGLLHPIGNWGNRFAVDLQRKYHPEGEKGPVVTAGEYYALTPGHNPHLIDHLVEPAPNVQPPTDILDDDDKIFSKNLDPIKSSQSPDVFFARSTKDNQVYAWKLRDRYADNHPGVHRSNYWIGSVPPDIIRNHGDIWSPASMEMLAGIYRLTETLGPRPPPAASLVPLKQD